MEVSCSDVRPCTNLHRKPPTLGVGMFTKTRQLHNITVSEIGMGCMGFSHGYGEIPPEDYADIYYLHRISPDVRVEDIAEAMNALISRKIIRGWGLSMVNAEILERANNICHLAAVQNIYSVMDRDYEKGVIPFCLKNDIGFVAFSPTASGYLSGKVKASAKFEGDDVRKWVPQMKSENITANQPLIDLLKVFAERKHATNTQIGLAWMLKKYPHVVPIPGSKNQERILENLGACNVVLSDGEFGELEEALKGIKIHGSRKDIGMPQEFID